MSAPASAASRGSRRPPPRVVCCWPRRWMSAPGDAACASSARRRSKKALPDASAASEAAAWCALLAAAAPAPSNAGCGAPPGVRTQTGPGRPPRSTTRSTLSAPCARSWSRIPAVPGPSLNTKWPSSRSNGALSWHMTRSAQSTPMRITAVSPRLVTRVWIVNCFGPSEGSVTTRYEASPSDIAATGGARARARPPIRAPSAGIRERDERSRGGSATDQTPRRGGGGDDARKRRGTTRGASEGTPEASVARSRSKARAVAIPEVRAEANGGPRPPPPTEDRRTSTTHGARMTQEQRGGPGLTDRLPASATSPVVRDSTSVFLA